MQGVAEILSGRFGIYWALVTPSLEIVLSDSRLLDYLGAGAPSGKIALDDLFPEFVGLEGDIEKVLSGEADGFCIHTVNRAPGDEIFFDLFLYRYRPAERTALVVVKDVTAEGVSLRKVQQRRNELILKNQELVQREEFVRTLLDTMPNPVYYRDPEGRLLGCNAAFGEFLGRTREEIIGKTMSEILPPGNADAYVRMDGRLDGTGKSARYETSLTNARGEERYVIFDKGTLPGAEGGIGGIVGVLSDITERRSMENRLRELGTAVEKSPATIIITDATGRIVYVNQKFVDLTGYSREEAIGNNPRMLKSGVHGPEFYRELWDALLGGDDWYGEIRNRKKNGDLYWELASISPVRGADGAITNFVAVKEDITKLKSAMSRLEISERELRIRNGMMEQNMLLAQRTMEMIVDHGTAGAEGVSLACRYRPMEGIGGDYYFVRSREGGGLSIFLCDIAGHGVAAALFLTLVKYITDRLLPDHGGSPAEYLERLNNSLFSNMSSFYITGIYGIMTLDGGGVFRFANGAQPFPILMKADGSLSFLGGSSTVIGMKRDIRYHENEAVLSPGDTLFLYTDGIPEARDRENEIIGFEDSLLDLFARSRRSTLDGTMDAVIREVESHRGGLPPDDDILLLGFEITRPSARRE